MKTLAIILLIVVLVPALCWAGDKEKNTTSSGISKEVVAGITEAAKDLSMTVDEFMATTAGKLLWWILVWKYLIKSILGVILGVPLVIFGNYYLYKIYWRYFGYLQEDLGDGQVRLVPNYEFRGDGALGCAFALTCIFVTLNVLGVIMIFI